MYLRWSELTVHEASNGLDALRAVELAAPDVIVLDFNMPVMNGRDVLDELKANPATQHIPVLVVTGEDCARPLGAARLLRKPVSPPELLACLLQLLRRAAPADPGESGGRTATD
jgi:twitching motility two-component system response regulator PilH